MSQVEQPLDPQTSEGRGSASGAAPAAEQHHDAPAGDAHRDPPPRVVPPPPPAEWLAPAAEDSHVPRIVPVPVMGPEYAAFGNPRPVDYRNLYMLTISSISGNTWTLMSLQADGSVWAYTVMVTHERCIQVNALVCQTSLTLSPVFCNAFFMCSISLAGSVELLPFLCR